MSDIFNLTDTWNNGATAFSAIKMNVTDTASAVGSKLIDLQIAGVSKFSVSKLGAVLAASGTEALPGVAVGAAGTGIWETSGSLAFSIGGTLVGYFAAGGNLIITNQGIIAERVAVGGASDLSLQRDAASVLAIRNHNAGATAMTVNVYNTFTDASNYERNALTWSGNVCYQRNQNAGTGSARLYVPVHGSVTVANLPAAATAGVGARAFVSDAVSQVFGATVTGGGSTASPVYSDGAAWRTG